MYIRFKDTNRKPTYSEGKSSIMATPASINYLNQRAQIVTNWAATIENVEVEDVNRKLDLMLDREKAQSIYQQTPGTIARERLHLARKLAIQAYMNS